MLTRLCAKFISNITCISFLKAHFGYLESSVDPDQPASSEAAGSDTTLFFQAVYATLHNLERVTCIRLLKIASDNNFNLLFLKTLQAFSINGGLYKGLDGV